ncbi:hypothetical protein JXB01_01215, partial [Candidatus Micrarchaeota archaeon]|nr:hypothetical protein [Candidatus Micrarchaeota archaeon]
MREIPIIIITALLLLYFIVSFENVPGLYQFLAAIVVLFFTGKLLGKYLNVEEQYGLLLLRTKKGLRFIEKISRHEKIWNFLADVGLVIAYG